MTADEQQHTNQVESLEALLAAESASWMAAVRCAETAIRLDDCVVGKKPLPTDPAGAVIIGWAQQAFAWAQRAYLDRQCRLMIPWSASLLAEGHCPRISGNADRYKAQYERLAPALVRVQKGPAPYNPAGGSLN